MKITNEMIDPEYREAGKIIKATMDPLFNHEAGFENILTKLYTSNTEDVIKEYNLNKDAVASFMAEPSAEGLDYSEKWIPRKSDGSKFRMTIYKSFDVQENAPVVLYLHGGGYAMGTSKSKIDAYRNLIAASNCVVVAPDYRLSIEAPYPAALHDAYDALLWVKENAKELGVRDDQIIIAGESAGGGLTAALSLYARDKKEVNIAFQMPLYPMIDDRMTTESATDNDAPVWDSKSNEWGWKIYLGELYGKDVPAYAAAARATDYKNLPPTISFVGSLEPFRDETIEYVENLKKAGVPVEFRLYNGVFHGFDSIIPNSAVATEATKFLMDSFKYGLENYFAKQPLV